MIPRNIAGKSTGSGELAVWEYPNGIVRVFYYPHWRSVKKHEAVWIVPGTVPDDEHAISEQEFRRRCAVHRASLGRGERKPDYHE